MPRRSLVCAFAALPALAHGQGIPDPVVGGSTVPDGKWPDAVAVLGAKGTCTGTLIAPDVVLTAGHCGEIEPSQVIANATDYTRGGIRVGVQQTTSYPSWQTEYDVSVIVLAQPVAGVQPRAIGTSCTFQHFTNAMDVHLVGFGLTAADGTGDNTLLHEAMAPVVDPDCSGGQGCRQAIAPGGELVAGGDGTDSCFGDSGGPVYLDTPRGPVAIAAVSRGVDGSATPCGGGGIYVRTDKVVQWIEDTTARTIEKDPCDPGPDTTTQQDTAAGCSAAPGAGLSTLVLVALALLACPSGIRTKRPSPGRSVR